MRVYISGAITGTADYMERFQAAEDRLTGRGMSVVNPAKVNSMMPADTLYEEYMEMSFRMIDTCDAVYMMEGWKKSNGANREAWYAKAIGKKIMYEKDEEATETCRENDKEKVPGETMWRLTSDKPVEDMRSWELAHNCMTVKDHEAWYRDYEREIPLRRLIREIAECNGITLPEDDDDFDEELYCYLQYDPAESMEGMLGILNMLAWSHAENRETLKEYEDTAEKGLIVACHCAECVHKELIGKSGRVYCPIDGWKDPDDFCKRAKRGGK